MFIAATARNYVLILASSTIVNAFSDQPGFKGPLATHQSGYDITITTIGAPKYHNYHRGGASSIIGIGNTHDLLYTVPIELGDRVFSVNLDTGSSDLWVISDVCETNACEDAQVARYPESSLRSVGLDVDMTYGDSSSGTYASGTVGLDTVTVAGIAMEQQPFGLVNDTTNLLVQFNAGGILGLGFPAASSIQESLVTDQTGIIDDTDDFIMSTTSSGPFLSRVAMTGAIGSPLFSVSLDRNTTDVGGKGLLTVGKLPEGIDNSSLTWVPVRLYSSEEGGMGAPSFALDEVYPYRWEVEIDGVFLDGQRLPDSAVSAHGVDSHKVSALIDTGNSILRGPEDVVNGILTRVSPTYDPSARNPSLSVPCNIPRTLAFQIGGQMFPIDPRDFISQLDPGNAITCQADNLVPTDAPARGALFRWSLGTPFFRSNLVAFYYGNLTHPSVDPPRVGFRSNVPGNADQLLTDAVRTAQQQQGDKISKNIHALLTMNMTPSSQIAISTPSIFTPAPKSSTVIGSDLDHRGAVDHLLHVHSIHGYLPLLTQIIFLLPFCMYII